MDQKLRRQTVMNYVSSCSGMDCKIFEILISRENFTIEYPCKTAIHNWNEKRTISWEDENISCLVKALLFHKSTILNPKNIYMQITNSPDMIHNTMYVV